jgi:hypothetical protein
MQLQLSTGGHATHHQHVAELSATNRTPGTAVQVANMQAILIHIQNNMMLQLSSADQQQDSGTPPLKA